MFIMLNDKYILYILWSITISDFKYIIVKLHRVDKQRIHTDFELLPHCYYTLQIKTCIPKKYNFQARSQNFEKRILASSYLSVCLSVHTEQLSSHWTDFRETSYLSIFLIFFEKIQLSFKSDKNNGYFTWKSVYMYHISPISSQNERYFIKRSQRKSKHILCSIIFSRKQCWL